MLPAASSVVRLAAAAQWLAVVGLTTAGVVQCVFERSLSGYCDLGCLPNLGLILLDSFEITDYVRRTNRTRLTRERHKNNKLERT